jgi:hypothetical protein
MIRMLKMWQGVVLAALLALGCNSKPAPQPAPEVKGPSAEGKKYLLEAEPAEAKGVLVVRKEAADGDEVIVVGRIGGRKRPFVEGRASFTIVDPRLKSCQETEDDACPTPWDYCCTPPKELAEASATFKFVNAEGQTLASDSRQLLGVKELQTVIVRGKAKRSEGNLVVEAERVFVRP